MAVSLMGAASGALGGLVFAFAADHLQLTGVAGRIAPGYSADIIGVDGDPTQDVTTLMNVRLVVARGAVHKSE